LKLNYAYVHLSEYKRLEDKMKEENKISEEVQVPLKKLSFFADLISQQILELESKVKVLDVQETIYSTVPLFLGAAHRQHICEGLLDYRAEHERKRGYVYVMNDIIIICSVIPKKNDTPLGKMSNKKNPSSHWITLDPLGSLI